MYGIIHSEIFNSTLMAEGYEVTYVFMSMISLADDDDCLKFTASTLATRIFMPLDKVEHALDRLSKPDPESESKEFEGRRIVAIKDIIPDQGRGWFVVNREKYIEVAQKKRRKQKMRDLMRERRSIDSANKGRVVSKVLAHIDVDIDKNADGAIDPKEFIWTEGLKLTGITRSFLGKLCKDFNEPSVIQAILRTKEHAPAEPKSFMLGCLREAAIDPAEGAI